MSVSIYQSSDQVETDGATFEGNSEDIKDVEPEEVVEEPPLLLQPQVIVITGSIIFIFLERIVRNVFFKKQVPVGTEMRPSDFLW